MTEPAQGTYPSGSGIKSRTVAGFLNWAEVAKPAEWQRRFFVLYGGWFYRFPTADIVRPFLIICYIPYISAI
jgi:hypothetical protein